MASNIIQLSFNGETSVVSEELVYKYDYGQQIEFTDLTLPECFEVHFSNNKTGKATKQIGHNGVVDIPDRYLEIGSVYGWIFLHNTDSDGETEYEFKIPVKNRAMPSDGEVTPEQESAISQAIAALTSTQASVQALHDETEGYKDDASASSSSAHDAQTAAESAQDAAEMAETSAGFSKIAAEAAQSAAETAQGKAEDAQTAAESAQAAAEAARDDVLGMSAEAETLPAGSSATASYADGVLSLGIPRGDKGETGDTGATGDTGNGIASIVKTSTSGLVDTYTITYTDGTTSTFNVTNGKDGEDSDVLDVQIGGTSILSGGVADIPYASSTKFGVVKAWDMGRTGDDPYNSIRISTKMSGGTQLNYDAAKTDLATTSKRGLMSKNDKIKLDGIASGAEVNVQSDWNQTDTSADDYIKNKPSVPTKVSDLENDVPYAEEASLKSALPTNTASGSIASFPDGTDLFPALSVKAQIEPIQSGSGTPSPDNVRPISGHTEVVTEVCGVNVWDEEWEKGTFNTTTGQNINNTQTNKQIRAKNLISIVPNATYHFNVPSGIWCIFYDKEKNVIAPPSYSQGVIASDGNSLFLGDVYRPTSINFPMPSNAYYMRFYCQNAYGDTYNHDISINYPSTDHDYHAYDGNTYTTTLGRTVYGGTLDVVSGELVVDRAMVTLDGSTISYPSNNNNYSNIAYASFNKLTTAKDRGSATTNAVAEFAETDTATTGWDSADKIGKMFGGASYDAYWVGFPHGTTIEEMRTGLSGRSYVYELATPQTYQLDPQTIDLLLGQNNVWTDCGSVEVTYKADIQKYIDKKFAELQALVLEQ